jgi:transposase
MHDRDRSGHAQGIARAAAVDDGTGKVRGSRQIKAEEPGHLAAVRWARELDEERVWAIEDCRSCSCGLEQALLAAGERVVRVPPNRMGASHKGEREPGKSDEIDALAVARAVVKDGVERFPVAYPNEQARGCRSGQDRPRGLELRRLPCRARRRPRAARGRAHRRSGPVDQGAALLPLLPLDDRARACFPDIDPSLSPVSSPQPGARVDSAALGSSRRTRA